MGNKSYSKGISWIDDCRIPFVDEKINFNQKPIRTKEQVIYGGGKGFPIMNNHNDYNTQGRFPANILVSDDMLNDGNSGGSSYCSPTDYFYELKSDEVKIFGNGKGLSPKRTKTGIGDKGTNSRYYDIDKWFDKILND